MFSSLNLFHYSSYLSCIYTLFYCEYFNSKVVFTKGETKEKNITNYCYNREKLIGAEVDDLSKMIEIEWGQSLKIDCNYCDEKDDGTLKLWNTYNFLSNDTPIEIQTKELFDKYKIKKDFSLEIKKVDVNDSGFYNCRHTSPNEDAQEIFQYYIDVVNYTLTPQKGDLRGWNTYVEKYITSMNNLFRNSNKTEYITLRDILGVKIKVVSEWGDRQQCDGCKGIMENKVFCRMKPSDNNKMDADNMTRKMLKIKNYFSAPKLSCHSMQFEQLFPAIAGDLNNITNFIVINKCKGPCRNILKGEKVPKYYNQYELKEGSYLTLTCPEATAADRIVWQKNGKNLTDYELHQRVEIDTFGTLFLNDVTVDEAGNYTCYVDNIYMQKVEIIISEVSIFHTQEFYWQNFYFLVLLSTNFIFFAVFMFFKWKKRGFYKTVEEILEEEKKNTSEFEDILKKLH